MNKVDPGRLFDRTLDANLLHFALIFSQRFETGTISPYTCSDVELPIRSLKSNDLGFFSNNITKEFNSTLSLTYDKCSVAVINQSEEIFRSACTNGYRYESKREKSFVTEWDLVCEKSALPEVTQTILNLGQMCGSFLFPALSDRYGRRPVFIICQLLSLGMAIVTAFVPNYASFISMRFLHGATMAGIVVVSGIMLIELIPTQRRAWAIHTSIAVWTLSLLVLVLVGYLCREMTWRSMQLVLAAFSCLSLVQYWLVEESIRWLSANNKHEDAEKLLKKAAKTNSVDAEAVIRLYRRVREKFLPFSSLSTNILPNDSLKSREEPESVGNETTVKGISRKPREFSAFFTNRSIFTRTSIVMYIWFSDCVAYYGLLLLSSSLVDDLYLGFTLSVFSEIPAAMVFIVLNERYNMGRRRLTIVSHLLGGLFLLIASLLGKIPAACKHETLTRQAHDLLEDDKTGDIS
ncbi:solute carrier family 22 member 6-A [Elysia marginata]|uniref:Solute carrier family 22 member 6-A n=1 Tax=Elysia marginata TaxID=1093978 RepID=A0AAV4GRX3_9GAST|nr:solute carrier family 22 member 6-A [Elysia marginata]